MSHALTTTQKNGDIVLTKEQAADVDAANAYHAGSITNGEAHIIHSFMCGGRLEKIRSRFPERGNRHTLSYEGFLKVHCPRISLEAQRLHRHTYKTIISRVPTIGSLESSLLPGPTCDAKAKEQFLCAYHESFDGKDVTAFWRGLGFVKKPKPLGRAPGEGGRKRIPLAEQQAAEQKQAFEDWFHPTAGIAAQQRAYGIKFARLTDAQVQAQIATMEADLTARKTWLKTPVPDRNIKAIEKILKGDPQPKTITAPEPKPRPSASPLGGRRVVVNQAG